MQASSRNRLDRPVDETVDHILGADSAEITLLEFGSYACPHCRAANDRIAQARDELGDRIRYVFRHRPLTGVKLARRAAEIVETVPREHFWDAHVALMTRSPELTEDDVAAVAHEFGQGADMADDAMRSARLRVEADEASARASGVRFTPSFFINGRRYDGPWDESSFIDAMTGSLGHRVRAAALDFASWAPSTGLLLLAATLIAVAIMNSPLAGPFEAFWEAPVSVNFGETAFRLSLRHWINDALLAVFFLVVGLEIKREFTVGRLASRRSAAMPVAAAIGGMVAPALIYLAIIPSGVWAHGWGVPMATDTAFAVALIVMLGSRVPVELRIFLTAAAIVDDIGAILVVAIFYSDALNFFALTGAALFAFGLIFLNRSGVYRPLPYMLLGVGLWGSVFAGGLHATLAGVLLALFIPTRPPPDLTALMVQANVIIRAESKHNDEVLRHGPSLPALRALDAIHDRIESPADRLLRHVEPWSSYVVLPLFALANAGVVMASDVFADHEPLLLAIVAGLVIGKPVGLLFASWIAVRSGLAQKPDDYSWMQVLGAGALAGIGFTMSLFIAGQAFPAPTDFAAAKIAVFAASILSALLGVAILLLAPRREESA